VSSDLLLEHSAMLEAAENILAALRRRPRASISEVSRLRVRLSSLIRQHRTTEEAFIFGPLMREGGFVKLPHLEPIVHRLLQEKANYSEHIRKWTPQAIERDWEGYTAACEERISVFRQVIEEEARIYQLVLSLASRTLPRSAASR